jgi:hypothetical protein
VSDPLTLQLPPDLIDHIADRVRERLKPAGPIEDGWLRGADKIASYIDAPASRIYALASARRIPVHKDGSALIARRSELDEWIRSGGGCRP